MRFLRSNLAFVCLVGVVGWVDPKLYSIYGSFCYAGVERELGVPTHVVSTGICKARKLQPRYGYLLEHAFAREAAFL